jgi:hypothetical protein
VSRSHHELHVGLVFDESSFPIASSGTPPDDLDSLVSFSSTVHAIALPYPSSVAGTSETVAMPCVAPTPSSVPLVAPTPPSAPRVTP